jgi:hypothetical protein
MLRQLAHTSRPLWIDLREDRAGRSAWPIIADALAVAYRAGRHAWWTRTTLALVSSSSVNGWQRTIVGSIIGAVLFGGAATAAAPNPGVKATLLGVGMGLVIGAFLGLTYTRRG